MLTGRVERLPSQDTLRLSWASVAHLVLCQEPLALPGCAAGITTERRWLSAPHLPEAHPVLTWRARYCRK